MSSCPEIYAQSRRLNERMTDLLTSVCALWYLRACLNAFVTALILSKNCILNAMYKIRLVKNRVVNLKIV